MNHSLSVTLTMLIACVSGFAIWTPPAQGASEAGELTHATAAFVASLTPELQKVATRSFDDAERLHWNFVPGRYAGVELGALDATQRAAAHTLLQALLSVRGYEKAMSIVQLENVLHELDSKAGHDASHRDPDRYSLLVCGEPVAKHRFMVRFQGHHVSLQAVVDDGKVVAHTPQFLGSNPHEVAGHDGERTRVLGCEEDLARAFLWLLDDTQLHRAVINEQAPAEVLLGPDKPPSALGERRGLPWSAMTETQRGVLWRLIEEYAHVQKGEVAAQELARIRGDHLDELSFAWAGGRERGQGHYYRIHGEHFAIEYDCTQDHANHVHTVWRDFEHDFGGDPLREHLEEHAREHAGK